MQDFLLEPMCILNNEGNEPRSGERSVAHGVSRGNPAQCGTSRGAATQITDKKEPLMSHTYTNLLSHVIFSTKDRQPLIDSELKPRLLGYMNGIATENGAKVLSMNSMPDHVHLLWKLAAKSSMSDALRILKTNSSR